MTCINFLKMRQGKPRESGTKLHRKSKVTPNYLNRENKIKT